MRAAGLESCNLIVCVDHTHSNTFTGRRTFQGRNLHEISTSQNFYEQAMRLVSRTLAEFDEDNLIPAYGFGSLETKSSKLFSYNPGEAPCVGLEGVLSRYRSLAPVVRLSGGTSFAPAIRKACAITASTSPPQYHILLLICDGQVSGECKAETRAAIQEAAGFPLSIVCIGVGDGPWEEMEEFDDMTERACEYRCCCCYCCCCVSRAFGPLFRRSPHRAAACASCTCSPPFPCSPSKTRTHHAHATTTAPLPFSQSTTFSLCPLSPPWQMRAGKPQLLRLLQPRQRMSALPSLRSWRFHRSSGPLRDWACCRVFRPPARWCP